MDKTERVKKIIADRNEKNYRKSKLIVHEPDKTSPILNENDNIFINSFRRKLYSNKRMSFKEWLFEFEDLIDLL